MTMTVKVIDEDGVEQVFEAARITAERDDRANRHPDRVSVFGADGHLDTYSRGTVYVMNNSGETVSQWFMPGPA